jgi:SNF2 family DNA or RNA helicase
MDASATSKGGPTADEEEQTEEEANKKAIREYNEKKRYYNELRKKQGGILQFRQDIELMKIQGAEDARRKKRERDLAKAQEEQGGESGLQPATNNEEDGESDGVLDFENMNSRKRRHREMPRKTTKQTSMQDAELQSMRVALEAYNDKPRKKKKGMPNDSEPQASSVSRRGRGSKTKSNSRASAKAAPQKASKSGAGRGAAKKKKQVENAIKQAASLINADVFQQQAGADANEQPTFQSKIKDTALKELIASVPLEDQGKAKGDMAILLNATRDFDGTGAVKSDGRGLWLVRGMKTSLKAYQILGTAFMRRRENAAEEPKGGLMADQMGLGKTLMTLGKSMLLRLNR